MDFCGQDIFLHMYLPQIDGKHCTRSLLDPSQNSVSLKKFSEQMLDVPENENYDKISQMQ